MKEKNKKKTEVSTQDVKCFWEENPLCSGSIRYELGTKEFFEEFDEARKGIEPFDIQKKVYEFDRFRNKKVLDVGCGNGWVLSGYAKGGAMVTGCDITVKAIEITQKRFSLEKIKGSLLIANAEDLPFKDNSFFLVTSFGVLHHTPNTTKAIEEIYRVVQKGGIIKLMFYHKNSVYYRMVLPIFKYFHPRFRGLSLQEIVNRVDGETNPLGKVYTKNELKRMLLESGFKDIRFITSCYTFDHLFYLKFRRKIPSILLNLLPKGAGWFLYVQAEK